MKENTSRRRLTRSRDDRFIGGVAAGIGRFLNIDPAIVRIAFVLSIIFGGIGVLAYLVLLAAVPNEGDPAEPAPQPDGSKRLWVLGGTVAMGILALVSIGVTGDGFGGWMFGFAQGFWFGVLIWALAIGGVYWLLREAKDEEGGDSPATTPTVATTIAPSPTQNAPAPSAAPAATASPYTPARPAAPAIPKPTGAAIAGDAPTAETPRTAETEIAPVPARSSDRPSTFGKVMTVIAIVASAGLGAIILAAISSGSTVLFGGIPMAAVLILLGGGLVVAALNNRHAVALWLLGAAVVIAIPMAIISIADLRVSGDYGEVREEPEFADDIPGDGYQLAAGAMTIDMRSYPFRPGQYIDLPVESGLGATRVIVPDHVCVSGSVQGKAGLAEVRGTEASGVGFERTFPREGSGAPVLSLEADMKVGFFQVIDNTTWKKSGGAHGDEWGGTVDQPRRQDEARKRAKEACNGPARKTHKPARNPENRASPSEKGAARSR